MKGILFTTALITVLNIANAQTSGGPDGFGYTWKDSNDPNGPVYNWIDIVPLADAQEVKLLGDDNTRGPFAINFPFHYYWYDVDQFWVGSNGYVIFQNGALASPFPQIPNTLNPQDYCGVLTSDLNFDGAGNPAKCWYWRSPGNDTLIVSWLGVPFWQAAAPSYTGSNSFQVIFSTVDSSITMQYMEQTGLTNTSPIGWMNIGIENYSGAVGLMHSFNTYPPVNYAIKYYYPQNVTAQFIDAACEYNDNESTGGLFLSKNGGPYTLKTAIKDRGNTTLNPFNVQCDVKDAGGFTQVSNAVLTDTLQAQETQLITLPSTFAPVAAGTYRFRTQTLLGSDPFPSNNVKVQELVVVDTTTASQWLSFDDGVPELGGISWQGGNGGVGMHFIPPYYPCQINSIRCFVINDPNVVGFSTLIYDDDGVNGSPLSLIDSQFIFPTMFNTWTTVTLPTPVTVTSGSVYVAWYMGGDGILIGQDTTGPISNRSYEILGSTWAIYRSRETEDLMVNINISPTTSIGISENSAGYVSEPYPAPADIFASMDYNLESPVNKASYEIYDLQGKKLQERLITRNLNSASGRINIDVQQFNNGIYICKLKLNDQEYTRRISVIR